MTEKISIMQTYLRSYRNGYEAAVLYRKTITENPHTIGTLNADAWKKGHKNGQDVVTFHTTHLHTRPSTSWFYT